MGFGVSAVCRSITNSSPSLWASGFSVIKGNRGLHVWLSGRQTKVPGPREAAHGSFIPAALTAYGDKRALHTPPGSLPPLQPSCLPALGDDCPPPSPHAFSPHFLPFEKPDPLASRLLCSCFLSSAFPLLHPSAVLCPCKTGWPVPLPPLRPQGQSLLFSLSGHLPHPLKVTFTFNAPQGAYTKQPLDNELLWAKVAGTSFLPLCVPQGPAHPVTLCD